VRVVPVRLRPSRARRAARAHEGRAVGEPPDAAGAAGRSGSAAIDLTEVGVAYGPVTAVAGLTARVEPGEWVGVIGPNGAGKTSLLRAVAGLVPYEGVIRVQGAATTAMTRRALAQRVACVPQQPELPPDMTAFDYALLGRTPHIGYLSAEGPDDRAACVAMLDRLGLGAMASRRLGTMSGGELQRLVIARALTQGAPVLLLDEPTSALDLGRRMDALELVDELRAERGLTVLSAIHDLTLAGQFAERLWLLAEGRLAADGPPDAVLAESDLEETFGASVRVLHSDGELVVVPRRAR